MSPLKYQRTADIIATHVDGEWVSMDVAAGYLYGMNDVGAKVWEILEHPSTLASVCEQLCQEFEVDEPACRAAIEPLIAQLLEAKLIISLDA